jgi:molybdopterin-synthase adenylyltransferase
VLAAAEEASRQHYPTTLFAASEAHGGRCTARSTIYAACVAAGLMIHQFCRWLRGQRTDADQSFNMLASELVVHLDE